MEAKLRERLGAAAAGLPVRRSFDGRLVGQSWEIPFVEIPDGPITAGTLPGVVSTFHDAYAARNGNRFDLFPVEGVTYRVELIVPAEKVEYALAPETVPYPASPEGALTLSHVAAEPIQAEWFRREALATGATVTGPAVIREQLSTTYIPPGQQAVIGRVGEIVITAAPSGEKGAR